MAVVKLIINLKQKAYCLIVEIQLKSIFNHLIKNKTMHLLEVPIEKQNCFCNDDRIYSEPSRDLLKNWDLMFIEKKESSRNISGNIRSPNLDKNCNTNITSARKVATLKLNYYPEGDWGWIIVLCGVMIAIINHGLQYAAPIFLLAAGHKFQESFINSADMKRSKSLPHIFSRNDSGIGYSHGSCSDIDQVGYQPENNHNNNNNHHQHHHHGAKIPYEARLVAELKQLMTLRQHYYPEGGWGWLITIIVMAVQCISHGLHTSIGVFIIEISKEFSENNINSGWVGALSTAVALLISPITIGFCKRKSTRITAVIGGLVTALGCLFTSFASQFHQLFFSYGAVVGVGVGMTRDCSTLMVAQYFKRRREFVEIFIVSGSGLGVAIMSAFIKSAIDSIGWRLGLQAVTGVVFLTFILGTFYRSASLYHPQRRAILHLKNQKRKIKDKNKHDDGPPFFDFKTLKSKTVRILLVSTLISAFGVNTPIFYLAYQVEKDGIGDKVILLQTYLGLAWTLGCFAFGLLVVHQSVECRIARQYLCQTAVFICGLCILALTAVHGNYHGYVLFVWIYGIFCGGYHYSLKMYTLERVRARNFARAWGFVQCSQALPIAIGVPLSGYMNIGGSGKAGYYFSSTSALLGSLTLFFIDLHRRNISRHKHTRANGTRHICVSESCPQRRKLSFSQEPDNEPGALNGDALILGTELLVPQFDDDMKEQMLSGDNKPELTCISEEGIADMDLPDNFLEDLDYVGDCITSCNKVENYLMLSEFENNLNAELPILMDKRFRKLSLPKLKTQKNSNIDEQLNDIQNTSSLTKNNSKWQSPGYLNSHVISVIDEASV